MRHYEIVMLINSDQNETILFIINGCENLIKENGGKVHRKENCGYRSLSYSIKNINRANYILFNIECNSSVIQKIKNFIKMHEIILRYLIIRKNTAITNPSILSKKD